LRAYSALGVPSDSVRSTFTRADRMLARAVPLASRAALRRRVFATSVMMSPDDLGVVELAGQSPQEPLLAMRAAIARRDVSAARAAGARFETTMQGYSPGTTGIDRATAFATMLLALGDSAAAVHQLDNALEALPRTRRILLETTPQAACVGRALLLRAQLAQRAGDLATARRHVTTLSALWRRADAAVRAPLDSLQRLL